jgi:hypothetical protein
VLLFLFYIYEYYKPSAARTRMVTGQSLPIHSLKMYIQMSRMNRQVPDSCLRWCKPAIHGFDE